MKKKKVRDGQKPTTDGSTKWNNSADDGHYRQPPVTNQLFNSVAVPFPPRDEFYGPTYVLPDHVVFGCQDGMSSRRQSMGSTIADLLNYDSDADSELQNLDWSDPALGCQPGDDEVSFAGIDLDDALYQLHWDEL